MKTRALFDAALEAARNWHAALPAMQDFCVWPDDLQFVDRPAVERPVLAHLERDPGTANDRSRPLRDAIVALAPHLEWRLTYTEDEVGADFLQRFGWFELLGPDGHFLTDQVRMTVGYWGPNLHYGRHQHEPEELYTVVSGQGAFMLDGADTLTLGPGDTRLHPSNQPHALDTHDHPILTFVIWRGDGLANDPRMTST